jgi:hypothetical protein
MNAMLEDVRWGACLSGYRLDCWRAGELSPAEAAEVQSHLAVCPRCREVLERMRSVEAEFRASQPPLRALEAVPRTEARRTQRPGRRVVRWLAPAGAVALAAGLLVALQPEPGVRSKGGPVSMGMFVQHRGEVRRAIPGETVAPGDTVRFTYSTPERRYLAILSVDGAGVASIYFPDGPEAVAVEPAEDAPLPLGTQLDGVLGEEQVVGLFCDAPRALEPIRQALRSSGAALPEVPGCALTTFRFTKH